MKNNTLTAYKYNLYDNRKAIIIYYFVVLALLVLMFIGLSSASSSSVSVNGLDFATVVFLFVAGLVSFKECFRMFMQNGVSRKSIFLSKISAAVSIAFIMTVIDSIILIICRALLSATSGVRYRSVFEQAYAAFLPGKSGLLIHIDMFIYNFLLYILMLALGFFISLLFYRLNKGGKIAVAVGVPVALTMVFPLLDGLLFHFAVNRAITRFLGFAFGYPDKPYAGMISFLICSAIIYALSWLLMRKAVIKE